MPAGIAVDTDELQRFLDRRAPGRSDTATPRREADAPEFLGGITEGRTNGAPIAALIRNGNTRSADYDELRRVPRPGHADFTARERYGGWNDVAGGGHFSGRLTAPVCIAGGIALQALRALGIEIAAHIACLGPEGDRGRGARPPRARRRAARPPARTRLPLHLLRGSRAHAPGHPRRQGRA